MTKILHTRYKEAELKYTESRMVFVVRGREKWGNFSQKVHIFGYKMVSSADLMYGIVTIVKNNIITYLKSAESRS